MKLKLMAKTNLPILIEGDTGTGKTKLAKEIHESSNRSKTLFNTLNVASVEQHLFHSELFGHVKGSFTGAHISREGFCEKTQEGTLFLDEIGELTLSQQASLLTLIDEGYFYKVGSTRKQYFKGRLIFATNKDLAQEVKRKEFREDLYFRLRFCYIKLKPLREKPDYEQLILKKFNNLKVKYQNFNISLSESALNVLFDYSWPGNYRELESTLTYLIHLDKEQITCDDIPSWVKNSDDVSLFNDKLYKNALAKFEENFLKMSMRRYNGKINLTALETGINKVTLISKLKKYDINRKLFIRDSYRQADGF